MEKLILTKTLHLDTAPVHVAPGGSVLYHLTADAAALAKLLRDLMGEIAFGMADVEAADSKAVKIDIYFGAADADDFTKVFEHHRNEISVVDREDMGEGTERMGLSMQARNLVIRTLEQG